MLSKENMLAQKIIAFYADKNVDCSVVSDKSNFLVTLRSWDRTHKFTCANRLPGITPGWTALDKMLDLEFERFQAQPAPALR